MTDAERFRAEYTGSFEQDPNEQYLYELGKEYHERCEMFDVQICQRPDGSVIRGPGGSAVAGTPEQQGLINRNANEVRRDLQQRALRERNIGPDAVTRAIQRTA